MSLVGFRAQNHPQQVARPEVDDMAVRLENFAPLHERFAFTIDAAASQENARLPHYWTVHDDALARAWGGERVWCNPPYSNIRPWVQKAWQQWGSWHPPAVVVMLLPANRTEQSWWQDLVEPNLQARRYDFCCEFLSGRMRFDRPNAVIGPKGDRPPFGCCLLIWGGKSAADSPSSVPVLPGVQRSEQ